MKLTVTDGIRVVHDGKVYTGGQSVDVPKDVAEQWATHGWAAGDDGPSESRDARRLDPEQFKSPEPAGKSSKSSKSADPEPDPEPQRSGKTATKTAKE